MGEFSGDSEVRDRDGERKAKGKIYADIKRNAVGSGIQKGDKVLLRQEWTDKLSTNFKSEPFTVLERNRNCVSVQSDSAVQYKRNITHVKKFLKSDGKQPELSKLMDADVNRINSKQSKWWMKMDH